LIYRSRRKKGGKHGKEGRLAEGLLFHNLAPVYGILLSLSSQD